MEVKDVASRLTYLLEKGEWFKTHKTLNLDEGELKDIICSLKEQVKTECILWRELFDYFMYEEDKRGVSEEQSRIKWELYEQDLIQEAKSMED